VDAAVEANNALNKLWCTCEQPENSRFMIYCDVHGEGCKIWYHGDCVGITRAHGRHLKQSGEQYVCPVCLLAAATSSGDRIEPISSPGIQLLSFSVMSPPTFMWEEVEGEFFVKEITVAYDIVVHWRHNLFVVLFGKVGKAFVQELARLFAAYGDGSSLECIAVKDAIVMCIFFIAEATQVCQDYSSLECYLDLWRQGQIAELLNEGKVIQQCLNASSGSVSAKDDRITCRFVDHMLCGNVKAAIKVIDSTKN